MALALSRVQCAETALRLALAGRSEGAQPPLYLSDILAFIPEAVAALCAAVLKSDRKYLLQTAAATLPLTAGVATLASNIYGETIRDSWGAFVTHASYTRPLVWAHNLGDLRYPQPGGADVGLYHISGANSNSAVLYAYSSLAVPLTGNVIVTGACAEQTFETLASELEEDLIVTLADMAKAKASMRPVGRPNDSQGVDPR